ncbi:MAG TPA: polysaccharide biosynthesis tyrosine autokinase [Coleofasciculaceae cyanobacterium]|jgi:capsular exopolysaccharide synthesis family protein
MDSNLHIEEHIDFNQYWQVLKRRWIPATATFAGILALSLVAALASEDVYQAEAQLLIKPDRTSKIIGIPDGSPEEKKLFQQDKDPIETEAKILQSRPIVERVVTELDLKSEDGEPLSYKKVNSSLKVEPIIGTDLLQVTYEDPNPDVAVSFVKRVVELYSEDYALFNSEETSKARDFIDKELPKTEDAVRQAEENLRLFKNRNGISNLEGQIDAAIDSISQIENQLNQVNAELNDVNARYSRLQSQLGMSWQEASAVSSLSQSVSVQQTLSQLQKAKVQLAQKRNFLSDNAPQIISLKEEQADLTDLLEREIASTLGAQQQGLASNINILSLGDLKQAQLTEFANLGLQKEGLDQRLVSLKSAYDTYTKRSNLSPQLQEQQRELERKLNAATSTYETLLNKQKETGIIGNRDVEKVRVIADAAIAEDTVNPSGKIILAAGAMMGVLFGTAIAFLLDLKDNTIKNTQEVENLFAYPLHGVVPDLNLTGDNKQLQLVGSEKALPTQTASEISMMPLKEAYQNIQVNLKLLDADAKKKVIAVTSSVPQEGKSSVSANLGVARAQCGQRILLVDADMRRPTQHHIWEISNQTGLSNILNHEIEWQESVQNVMPNLDVLTSGTIPGHPISLLDSRLFEDFLNSVSNYYDQIIFDTPPIIGIADTKIIGKLIDGFLFVVRPGVADYSSATAAKKMLDSTGQKVLGVVVNGANMNREPYHYSSYYSTKRDI